MRQHKFCSARVLLVTVLLALSGVCLPAFAQSKVVYLTTGERFKGDITARDEQFLALKMEGATATIPLAIVDRIVDMVEERKLSVLLVESEQKAGFLRERILSGEGFENTARKHSYHPSAPGGGNIGFVRKEELDKPLSDAAFALNPGEVSKPITSLFGTYLVRLTEKRMIEPKEEETKNVEVIKKEIDKALITVSIRKFKDNSSPARRESLADSLARRFADELTSLGFSATLEQKEPAQEEPSQKPAPTYAIQGEAGENDGLFALSITVVHTRSSKTVFTTSITANSAEDYERAISQLIEEMGEKLEKHLPELSKTPEEPEKKEPAAQEQPEHPEAPEPPEQPEK